VHHIAVVDGALLALLLALLVLGAGGHVAHLAGMVQK
jgi:hypothetical protein